MTALERGQELMNLPLNQLPPVAFEHLKYITNKIGICMEVCLTVYIIYAQIVEGLECNDEAYKPDPESIKWYKDYYERKKGN